MRQSALDNDVASGEPHPTAGAPTGTQPLDLFPPLADEPGIGAAQGSETGTPQFDPDSPNAAHGNDDVRRQTRAPESFRHWQPAMIFSQTTLKRGMGAPETDPAPVPVPVPDSVPAPVSARAPAPDLEAVTLRRAIVLDPDADVRRLTACLLRQLGYEVTESESAEGALASCHRAPADLLVAECRLPGDWRGEALAKRLRRTAPNLKVILTSDTGLGAANSNFRVLLKPFGLDQLTALVNQDDRTDGLNGRGAANAAGDTIPFDVQRSGPSAAIVL